MDTIKAQIAMEYLIIFGFSMIATIAAILAYTSYSQSVNDQLVLSQIDQVEKEIVDAAETVHALGSPSKITLKAYFPEQISNLLDPPIFPTTLCACDTPYCWSQKKEILYKIRVKNGVTDMEKLASVTMAGNLPTKTGTYTIIVEQVEDPCYNVSISYK